MDGQNDVQKDEKDTFDMVCPKMVLSCLIVKCVMWGP